MKVQYFEEIIAVHHYFKYSEHDSLIIIKKYCRLLCLKVLRGRQSSFYQKMLLCANS